MDLLDDDLYLEPAVTNARVGGPGGKFQPKIKPQPKKTASAPVSSTLPNAVKEQPTLIASSSLETIQFGQRVDIVDNKLSNLVGSSKDASGISVTDGKEKDSEISFSDATGILGLVNSSSQVDVTREDIGLVNAQRVNIGTFYTIHTSHSSILGSAGQVESMEYGLDPFDDILPEPTTNNACGIGKIHPKIKKPKPSKDLSKLVDHDISVKENLVKPAAAVLNISNDAIVSSVAVSEVRGITDDSSSMNADIIFGLDGHEDFLTQPSSGVVHSTTKTHHETLGLHASSKDRSKDKSSIPVHGSADSSASMACEVARSGTSHCIIQDPIISTEEGDVNNDFELGPGTEERRVISDFERATMPGACITSDPCASELPVNEKPRNLAETSQLDDAVMEDALQSEDVPLGKMGVKGREGKTSTVSDHTQKSKTSSANGEKGTGGKPSRPLRKCSAAFQLIDESDDEAHGNSEVHAETPSNSAAAEVDVGNDEGGKSKKKRAPRKKPAAESEKPARKCRKVNKETDQSSDQPPKKFSHSTRRTRRQVDRTLLETPEEELELDKVPIRDLIMLYLHKERMENKETKSKKPSTQKSSQNDAAHDEEDTFGTERENDFTENQGVDAVEMTSPYFNYQSYMDKTRSAKWSKQDDELFYKCIRQFGIDLSMIQLLFPDRTRRQIKLKLKKEERKHPLRLTEAVQNPSKDHSQFELIIEQFKKAAADKAEEEFDGSESIGVTGDGDIEDIAPENNEDEATKPEKEEAGGNAYEPEAEDRAKVESPLEFDEIEDDFDINDYRSEY